jgi:hypothetical protein
MGQIRNTKIREELGIFNLEEYLLLGYDAV